MKKIDLFKVFMAPTAAHEVGKVLNSGYIGQGPKVEEFEENLKSLFNHDYVSTVNAGTSALHLALRLLKNPNEKQVICHGSVSYNSYWPGLEDGDEVLATPMTCTASNWPILANNLKIKWVDIDPTTLNMDLDDLARKITPKTKVIMLVHWGGYPNDLDKIKQINGVYFDWKDKTKELGFNPSQKNDVGVIAQEIQAILPEVVTLAPFDYELGKSKSGENYLTVKYEKIVPLLIEAIKELNQKVEDQQKIINDLLRR